MPIEKGNVWIAKTILKMARKKKKWKNPDFFQKTCYISQTIEHTVKSILYSDRGKKTEFTQKKWACPCA